MFRAVSLRQTLLVAVVFLLAAMPAAATQDTKKNLPAYVRTNYTRQDYQIPMRDGVQLYTVVYAPKDKTQKYPIMMMRTPYGVAPYAKDSYRAALGPNSHFAYEGYIFVYQDVRGCYMSEGTFVNMRPHLDQRKDKKDIDESTDTYDTIEWLTKNVEGHNGKVGLWGISYPGFYASAGMIDAHPALKAVSPQAPIADWFFDDFFHHGAFFLPHAFNFFTRFGPPRPKPTTSRPFVGAVDKADGYQFFLDIGPLSNANKKYFKNNIAFWNEMMDHPNYDAFWQARNILPHLKNCAPAVMTVGGWFDAEDLYGPLNTYAAVEKNNPNSFNVIVMGPWAHGGWSSSPGNRLGNIGFGANTSVFFQEQIELPFFNHFLKGKGEQKLPEAYMFETGVNKWRQFDHWPPKGLDKKKVYFHAGGKLAFEPVNANGDLFDEYISDPKKPVPFTEAITTGMAIEYMTDDQRFASKRPDVVVYLTEVLKDDVTLAGPIIADLKVSTSGTDSDCVVKVIDVYPQNAVGDVATTKPLAGYQMMVRSEIIRGRFRNSYEKPEPFKPGEPTTVKLVLQDVLHTFPKGHRIMVQVCSSWFPLADRNPQKYVDNIFYAEEKDFIKTTQRVYCSQTYPSALEVGILKAGKN